MIVLVWRRSKKLKADKNNISWIYGIMWLKLQMADLNIVRSSERTAEVGRPKGKMNIYSSCCLDLNKVVSLGV